MLLKLPDEYIECMVYVWVSRNDQSEDCSTSFRSNKFGATVVENA